MRRKTTRAPRRARATGALSVDHRAWVVENLLAGVAENVLVDQLATQLPRARALQEVRAIARSPLLDVCARLATRARQLELVCALGRSHLRGDPAPTEIERRTTPSADEFFRHYWAAHQPVLFTDALARSRAIGRWTPAWFKKQFGDARIAVTTGREADPYYDANYRAHSRTMTMGKYIDRVLAAGTSNDIYMVSNNQTMKRPRFRALLDDLAPPAALFEPLTTGAISLWIGPAGTVTPLHHDTTNILFCQIHGRKRVDLISPQETALFAEPHYGFYSQASPAALAPLLVKSVVVEPGEGLYIPAGWWHRVTALDVSISVSLLGFRRPNDFDWYRPGGLSAP